jgi:hypothetical protein
LVHALIVNIVIECFGGKYINVVNIECHLFFLVAGNMYRLLTLLWVLQGMTTPGIYFTNLSFGRKVLGQFFILELCTGKILYVQNP